MDTPVTPPSSTSGLEPSIAALLSYICPPFSGIALFVMEKVNQEVRFHALQSIFLGIASFVVFVGVTIVNSIFGAIANFLGVLTMLLYPAVGLIFFFAWILCMAQAYQGVRYKLPIVGDMAEKQLARG